MTRTALPLPAREAPAPAREEERPLADEESNAVEEAPAGRAGVAGLGVEAAAGLELLLVLNRDSEGLAPLPLEAFCCCGQGGRGGAAGCALGWARRCRLASASHRRLHRRPPPSLPQACSLLPCRLPASLQKGGTVPGPCSPPSGRPPACAEAQTPRSWPSSCVPPDQSPSCGVGVGQQGSGEVTPRGGKCAGAGP